MRAVSPLTAPLHGTTHSDGGVGGGSLKHWAQQCRRLVSLNETDARSMSSQMDKDCVGIGATLVGDVNVVEGETERRVRGRGRGRGCTQGW